MPRAFAIRVGAIPSGIAAPTVPFTVGTQVGVPTGTTLTTVSSSSLPTHDATESITLTHPVTGATAGLTVKVWRRKRFTGAPSVQAGTGEHFLFDECEFAVSNSSWAVDLGTTGAVANQMSPPYVFRKCTLLGNNTTERVLSGHYVWLMDCHITGGADAWQGAAYSVAERCNIAATTDTRNPDPHADGLQITDTGRLTAYRCWISAGALAAANAAMRIGTEFGAVQDVDVRYCGLDHGGYNLQVRGEFASLTAVTFIGNRFAPNAFYGPVDFVSTTGITWSNNAFFDGTPIPSP